MKATNRVGCMTQRRPFVSDKYPHKCDEKIMPENEAAPNIPLSLVVMFKSHCDTGITKLTPENYF